MFRGLLFGLTSHGIPGLVSLKLRRQATAMRIPPPSVLATWPVPNYDNPVTKGVGGKVVGVTLTALTTVILAIRVYTRLHIVRSFGMDDILIIVAFV
jgi:hypothetical protein